MALKKRKPTTSKELGWKTVRENKNILDYDSYLKQLTRKKGFSAYSDYLEYLAVRCGFNSEKEYMKAARKKHGFSSEKEHHKALAAKKGLETAWDYQKMLANEREIRLRNRRLSTLMKKRMQELDLSCVRLGKLTGISTKQISEYRRGMLMPKEDKLKKILRALGRDGITDKYDNFLEPVKSGSASVVKNLALLCLAFI